ncbi:MAG TPA: hypothetical protein VMV69_27085 [Pirellulales bacterium]|nr:hypothetical protein [Pirellulales bacterium]
MVNECQLTRIIQRGGEPARQAKQFIKLSDRQQTGVTCQLILPRFDQDGLRAQKTERQLPRGLTHG